MTLTELIISLSLNMVVMVPVGLVLINNTRFFNDIAEDTDTQRKVQIAMKELQDILYVSEGIYKVETGHDTGRGFVLIKSMEVLMPSGVRRKISVNENGNLSIDSRIVAEGILLEARPTDGTFTNTPGVELRMTGRIKNAENGDLRIINRIYFRNTGY